MACATPYSGLSARRPETTLIALIRDVPGSGGMRSWRAQAMTTDAISGPHTRRPFRILGICWLVYGVLTIVFGFWLVSFQNNATMMFGSLLGRVSDPFTLMDEFHLLYATAIVLAAVCGVLGILAGWALLANLRSARILLTVTAILSLPRMPLGTTLGIFSLILLFLSRREGAETAPQARPDDVQTGEAGQGSPGTRPKAGGDTRRLEAAS